MRGCSSKTVHIGPYFGKTKMSFKVGRFSQFSNFGLNLSAVCLPFFHISKLPPLKHILALQTLGQICTVSELQRLTFVIFQTEHTVGIQKRDVFKIWFCPKLASLFCNFDQRSKS